MVARIGIIVILVDTTSAVMSVSDRGGVLDAGAKIADARQPSGGRPAVLKAYLGAEKSVDRSRKTAPAPARPSCRWRNSAPAMCRGRAVRC